ncbi:hypothetical protein E4T39_04448 [Aureobasidium subglaciale]|nr:hypothetical protein E4T39_04448 [Aureobasidium subglaciale]
MATSNIVETTCVIIHKNELWPVFVFPDHSVPDGLIGKRPDITYLPVFFLVRNVFLWAQPSELLEWEPTADYAPFYPNGSDLESQRQKAHREALECHDMNYYHKLALRMQKGNEKVKQENAIILTDSDDSEDDNNNGVQFKSYSLFCNNASLRHDSDDDVPVTSVSRKRGHSTAFKRPGLPSPSPTPKHKKVPSKKPVFSPPFGEEDSDGEVPSSAPYTSTPSKKPTAKPGTSKWKPSGNLSKVAADDHVTRVQLELLMPKKVLVPVNDPLKVNIYVGDEKKLFILDRTLIQKHPSFLKHITGDNKNGFEICNAIFEKFEPDHFESLITWLKTGDYKPRLIDDKHPHLEKVKSVAQFEEAAERASILWNTAHKLQLTTLQDLIYRKIEVQSPLATGSLLMLTRLVFWNTAAGTEIDGKMREMLKHEVATRLYDIIEEEPFLFSRVMKSDAEFARHIWAYQTENPWAEPEELYIEEDNDDDDDDDDDDEDEGDE